MPLSVDPTPHGTVEGDCPYCGSREQMEKHRVLPRWRGAIMLFPSTELLVCPGCKRFARDESVLDRAMSALFLVPFLLGIGAAIATGLYLLGYFILLGGILLALWKVGVLAATLLGAMFLDWSFSGAYASIALVLLGAGGFAGWRAGRAFRRLLSRRRMLPLVGWMTDL